MSVELEGMKAGGQPFYFHAADGRWSLWLGPPLAEPNYRSWCDNKELVAEGLDPTRGTMSQKQVYDIVGEYLGSGFVVPIGAPYIVDSLAGQCNRCGRKSWSKDEVGAEDRLTQPDGNPCGGLIEQIV